MELHFEELLKQVSDFLKSEANTETVIGKEFKLGEFSCVPVIRVGMGFGSGGGEGQDAKQGKGQGAGAGAGIGIEPIAFLVTKDDEISVMHVSQSKGLGKLFEKAPDLIEKYFESQKKEAEKEKASEA